MKITKSSIAIAAVLIVGLLSCVSKSDERKNSETQLKKQAESNAVVMLPAFRMTDVDGHIVNMASLKGKKVFVNLWASWCPPCKAEIPSIEALASAANKENAVFVMLSLDENFEVAKKFAKKENLKVPIYYPAEKLPALFKTDGIPATFIFNEKGEMVMQKNGADDYSTEEYLQLMK